MNNNVEIENRLSANKAFNRDFPKSGENDMEPNLFDKSIFIR